jgi:hypothetical protein
MSKPGSVNITRGITETKLYAFTVYKNIIRGLTTAIQATQGCDLSQYLAESEGVISKGLNANRQQQKQCLRSFLSE